MGETIHSEFNWPLVIVVSAWFKTHDFSAWELKKHKFFSQDTAHHHHRQIHLTQIHQMKPKNLKKCQKFKEKFLMVSIFLYACFFTYFFMFAFTGSLDTKIEGSPIIPPVPSSTAKLLLGQKKMDWVNNFPFPAKKIDVIFRVIFPMFSMLFIGPIT